MALQLSFTTCENNSCSSLEFKETTGAYSLDNLNGWGSPNEDISGATAILTVTLADGSATDLAMVGFPTTDTTKVFTINAEDIGFSVGDQIPDQIISLVYSVTTITALLIDQTQSVALYCQTECCVSNMFLDIDIDCEDCIRSQGDKATKAYTLLQGLKFSAGCGNTTAFNKTLTYLNKLCKFTGCSNCK